MSTAWWILTSLAAWAGVALLVLLAWIGVIEVRSHRDWRHQR